MKHPFVCLLAALLAQGAFAAEPCRIVEDSKYLDWPTTRLSNGTIDVELLPAVGGRVMQVTLGKHEFLWVNEGLAGKVLPPEDNGWSNWQNYGGDKLWTAPQGWDGPHQWAGPGDPTHDGGAFAMEVLDRGPESVAVKLTGPTDATTGIQFTREIRLMAGESKVYFTNTMTNNGQGPQRWGIWQVTQHNAAAGKAWNENLRAYCPMNPFSRYARGYNVEFGLVGDLQWQPRPEEGLFSLQYQHSVGKVGLDLADGWLAVVDGEAAYGMVSRFPTFPNAEYPHGANAEFWVNGRGEFFAAHQRIMMPTAEADQKYYLESEVHSPYLELAPGQSGSITQEWGVSMARGPVVRVERDYMECKPLRLAFGRWSGCYGLFRGVRAALVVEDVNRAELARIDLGPVEPGGPLEVDWNGGTLPPGAHAARLLVTDEAGQVTELARAFID